MPPAAPDSNCPTPPLCSPPSTPAWLIPSGTPPATNNQQPTTSNQQPATNPSPQVAVLCCFRRSRSCRIQPRYLGSASPWAFPTRRSCWNTRAAKPTRANPSSSSASTICPRPNKASPSSASFLAAHPECSILATCRRHQNHGKFNGSVEDQIRILDAAFDAGARAVDVEIESAENAVPRLEALRGKGQLMLSYHNYDGTPSPESIVRRMLRIPADGYKIVTTARKPSDNSRILALTKSHAAHAAGGPGDGRDRFPDPRAGHRLGRDVHLRRAQCVRRHRIRSSERSRVAASLPRRKILARRQDLWRHRRSRAPLHLAGRAQSRVSVPSSGRGLSAVSGPVRATEGFFHPGRIACPSPDSASPFRTSRRSCAISTWSTPSPAASARSTRSGKKPENGAAPIPTPMPSRFRLSRKLRLSKSSVSGGRQRRCGSQRGVCAGGQRSQSFHRRAQSRPRAIPRPRLRRRVPAARSGERPQVRRLGPRHAARDVPASRRLLFPRTRSPPRWSSIWSTIRSKPRCCATPPRKA